MRSENSYEATLKVSNFLFPFNVVGILCLSRVVMDQYRWIQVVGRNLPFPTLTQLEDIEMYMVSKRLWRVHVLVLYLVLIY